MSTPPPPLPDDAPSLPPEVDAGAPALPPPLPDPAVDGDDQVPALADEKVPQSIVVATPVKANAGSKVVTVNAIGSTGVFVSAEAMRYRRRSIGNDEEQAGTAAAAVSVFGANEDAARSGEDGTKKNHRLMSSWLKHKSSEKILGRSMWTQYWAVLDSELLSIRFYSQEEDMYHGSDIGECNVQYLKKVTVVDAKQGKRFDVLTFDDSLFSFKTSSAVITQQWIEALKAYETPEVPLTHQEVSERLGNLPSGARPRRFTDLLDPLSQNGGLLPDDATPQEKEKKKERVRTTLVVLRFQRSALSARRARENPQLKQSELVDPETGVGDTQEDPEEADEEPSVLEEDEEKGDASPEAADLHKAASTFVERRTAVQVVDKVERTTHVTWTFRLEPVPLPKKGRVRLHKFKLELYHGRVWGKRKIYLNGHQIHLSRETPDGGSRHVVNTFGHSFTIVIAKKSFMGFVYALEAGDTTAAGKAKEAEEQKKQAGKVQAERRQSQAVRALSDAHSKSTGALKDTMKETKKRRAKLEAELAALQQDMNESTRRLSLLTGHSVEEIAQKTGVDAPAGGEAGGARTTAASAGNDNAQDQEQISDPEDSDDPDTWDDQRPPTPKRDSFGRSETLPWTMGSRIRAPTLEESAL